jgi:hypothetical protein
VGSIARPPHRHLRDLDLAGCAAHRVTFHKAPTVPIDAVFLLRSAIHVPGPEK